MAQDYLDQLAEFVAETRWEDFDATTVAAAKDVVLDTIGAILAGSRLSENANFAGLAVTMSGPGNATVMGHGHRVQPVWAAMVNATAGVSLEMDEGNRLGGGSPVHSRYAGGHRSGRGSGTQRSGGSGKHHRWLRGNLAHRRRDARSRRRCTPTAPGEPSARRRQRRG